MPWLTVHGFEIHRFLDAFKLLKPDYLLVFPWHFKNFILQKEKNYLNQGGKLIFPLPDIEIV